MGIDYSKWTVYKPGFISKSAPFEKYMKNNVILSFIKNV